MNAMTTWVFVATLLFSSVVFAETLPTDEAGAIAYLRAKGVDVKANDAGHAVRVMSGGKEKLTPSEYQLIGLLVHVEQMGINGAPLAAEQWGFLKRMKKLKRLSIWHCAGFATLEPFCGLPVESLTIGGCMGLRNMNRETPERQYHAITTLRDLPNLTYGNWYHSPLIPDDAHLAHVAEQFPKLENLRLDFTAPRGTKTNITPAGLKALHNLPLNTLSLENVSSFTPEHFEAVAAIKTLRGLLIDARRQPVSDEALAAFRDARPDVEVAVAVKGDKAPPRLKRKRK